MTALQTLRNVYCRMAGRFYIPPGLLHINEKKIVHISDTPANLYPALELLLAELAPETIVHTGDLADDIKLELEPGEKDEYTRAVVPFLRMLENSPAGHVIVVPGNHDDLDVINNNTGRTQVVPEGETVTIHGMDLGLAHRFKRLPPSGEYRLYGHNFRRGGPGCLNGMENVHIIFCPSGRVARISYPLAVNNDRKMVNSYGIPGMM